MTNTVPSCIQIVTLRIGGRLHPIQCAGTGYFEPGIVVKDMGLCMSIPIRIEKTSDLLAYSNSLSLSRKKSRW